VYHIEFDDPLVGGDSYHTVTTGSGTYNRWNNGPQGRVDVPPRTDLSLTPSRLSDPASPIGTTRRSVGIKAKPLSAQEGVNGTTGAEQLGTANQNWNVGLRFRVVPDPGTTPDPQVKLLAKGMIDGYVGVDTKALAAPPSASFSAEVTVEKLGIASASAASSGAQTEEVGLTINLSKEPGVEGAVKSSVQTTSASTGPKNFFLIGKVDVNTPLVCNLSATLVATNTENFAGGRSAAWSVLASQVVYLAPQPPGGGADPFYSFSVLNFQADTGTLTIAHPLAPLGTVSNPASKNDDGSVDQADVVDYSRLLPEVETILSDGLFSESDGLLGSLLSYSGITLSGKNDDGTISFSDGTLKFLDPSDPSIVRATADLIRILADPATPSFTATIANFAFVSLPADTSTLGQALKASGGVIAFDQDFIAETDNFTKTATATEASVVVGAPAEQGRGRSIRRRRRA
jgi:hypothetical protein